MATMTPPKMKDSDLCTMLMQLFADNFVTYFKSHTYHFNVEGPMFAQDHALLQEIYEFLHEQHDGIGEQIRQLNKGTPCSLKEVLSMTDMVECDSPKKPSKEMFTWLNEDFDLLCNSAQKIYDEADMECYGGLATFVGDYIRDLSKLNWKVRATLGKSFK
jgi:starvation-inducible DNA-binding protein